MISQATCPRPTTEFLARDLGDEYVFYDRSSDRVHILNGTARSIYLLCDGTRSAGSVARQLAEIYGVDERTALRDAAETIEELVRLGVLTV